MLKFKLRYSLYLIFPVAVNLQAATDSAQNQTMIITSSSKQSPYSASSQNVASYRVDSNRLEEANITNTQVLNKVLPGFNFAQSDSSLHPVTSIRGFTSVGNWYNSSVTLYVDGVPQMPVGFSQPIDDILSVEVLKGSQATLYGAAAEGGIINIITEQPTNDYKGYLSGGYASRNGYRGKINVSGPVSEGLLYASISGMRDVWHGRMYNPGTGHGNLGGEANNTGSIKLRLAPDNQPWQLIASYNGQCVDGSPGLAIDPATSVNNTTGKVYADDARDPSIHRCIQNQLVSGKYSTDHWLLTLTSSFQQLRIDKSIAGYSPTDYNYGFPERWLGDMQELRVSTLGKNNIIDGVFGVYRQNTRAQVGHTRFNNQGKQFSGYQIFTTMQSVAAYADITWHTTEQLDFGAGLRFSHDTAKTQYPNKAGDQIFSGDAKDDYLLGQVSAGYQFTDASRIYARIAQGYKPMGFDYNAYYRESQPVPYRPESSLTYEIGNKYHSDTINFQGAIFYNQVSNPQMYHYYAEEGPRARRLLNAGGSRGLGLELAGDYVFVPGWRIGANINLINDRFTADSKNKTASGDYINKSVPFVPKFTAGVYLSGDINTAIGTFSPYLGFNYRSSYSFDDNDFFKQSAYSITDIRLNWQATDRISISAYVDNLFDKRYFVYARYNQYGYVNFGRTAGVDLKVALF